MSHFHFFWHSIFFSSAQLRPGVFFLALSVDCLLFVFHRIFQFCLYCIDVCVFFFLHWIVVSNVVNARSKRVAYQWCCNVVRLLLSTLTSSFFDNSLLIRFLFSFLSDVCFFVLLSPVAESKFCSSIFEWWRNENSSFSGALQLNEISSFFLSLLVTLENILNRTNDRPTDRMNEIECQHWNKKLSSVSCAACVSQLKCDEKL